MAQANSVPSLGCAYFCQFCQSCLSLFRHIPECRFSSIELDDCRLVLGRTEESVKHKGALVFRRAADYRLTTFNDSVSFPKSARECYFFRCLLPGVRRYYPFVGHSTWLTVYRGSVRGSGLCAFVSRQRRHRAGACGPLVGQQGSSDRVIMHPGFPPTHETVAPRLVWTCLRLV